MIGRAEMAVSADLIPESGRLPRRFAALKHAGRAGLITFITAGDPDRDTSLAMLRRLPGAGADLIEFGMPFTDPMADGPAIQASSQRALKSGVKLRHILDMVRSFRSEDGETPLILMGYYNPIYSYGPTRFLAEARDSGVDGLIVVDLPPEEDDELCLPSLKAGIHFIRLATPTTDDRRLPAVLVNTTGFVYYVSITGITGTGSATMAHVADAVDRLKRQTELPVAVGFGIRSPEQAAEVARVGDAVVVGSALVERVRAGLDEAGRPKPGLVGDVIGLVESLAEGVRRARPRK